MEPLDSGRDGGNLARAVRHRRRNQERCNAEKNVGQPILAAAAFQAASLLGSQFPWSSAEPPRKAAAARSGCPTFVTKFHRKVSCTCLPPRKTSTTSLGFSGSFFLFLARASSSSSVLTFFSPLVSCQPRGSSRLGTLPRMLVGRPRRAPASPALMMGSRTSLLTGPTSRSEV